MLRRKDMSIMPVTLAAAPLKLFPPWKEAWEWGELVSVLTLDGKSAMVCVGLGGSGIGAPTSEPLRWIRGSPPQKSLQER